VVVHDHFRPYTALAGVDHAFLQRSSRARTESADRDHKEPWAEVMRDVLLDAATAVRQTKETGLSALEPDSVQGLVHRYSAGRPGRALLPSPPSGFRSRVQPEKAKETKVKMKISGCFRTFEGAGVFIRLRTHRLHRSKTGVSISSRP